MLSYKWRFVYKFYTLVISCPFLSRICVNWLKHHQIYHQSVWCCNENRAGLLLSEHHRTQFSPKHQHPTAQPHLHGNHISFCLSFNFPGTRAALGRKTPKTTCISRSEKSHFIVLFILVFKRPWKQTALVPARLYKWNHYSEIIPVCMVRLWISTILIFLRGITLPSYSCNILATWIMDVSLQTDTTLNPCSPPVQH